MKLKIVSDGSAMRTRIIDADTGECVEGVRYVDIHIGIDGTRAFLELVDPQLDLYNITPEVVS